MRHPPLRALSWFCRAALLLAVACSDVAAPQTGTVVVDASPEILFGVLDVLDSGGTQDSDIDASPDTGKLLCEFPAAPGPGEAGAPCSSATDCNTGYCVESGEGKVCTRQCLDCCPTGFRCAQAGDGDAIFVCLPHLLRLCRPCLADAECATKNDDALCIAYGNSGSFCGGTCQIDADCPTNYACEAAQGTTGQGKQCVLKTGECGCSVKATGQGASTKCSVTNAAGACQGSRKCTAEGLSACDAATPVAETCGGIDENCNGLTDEAGAAGCSAFWLDTDGDGFGQKEALGGKSQCLCKATAPYGSITPTDCNDANPGVNPGKPEVCNDADDNCQDGADEGCDKDKDGFCNVDLVVVGKPKVCPSGGGDCNDQQPQVYPGVAEKCGNGFDDDCNGKTDDGEDAIACKVLYMDGDQDGYGTADGKCLCVAVGLYTAAKNGDCNDSDVAVHPTAAEVCGNGKDDNCLDGQDEAGSQGCSSFWVDGDGDAWGSGAAKCLCAPDTTYTAKKGGDCNDLGEKTNPGMSELCNGIDDNCSGDTDEQDALGCVVYFADKDGDGWGDPNVKACVCQPNEMYKVTKGQDCDDSKPKANPAQLEMCDGYDNNCDGQMDEQNAYGCKKFFTDGDGDGFGTTATEACLCVMVAPWNVDKGADCNDKVPSIFPGAAETCNSQDDDCNGQIDEENAKGCSQFMLDEDGDSYGIASKSKCLCAALKPYSAKLSGDCADSNAAVHPGGLEVCNSLDDNCDGTIDNSGAVGCTVYYADTDKDGFGTPQTAPQCLCAALAPFTAITSGDCNDQDVAVFPKAVESCNGKDDDCNGTVDDLNAIGCKTYFQDDDGDTFGQDKSAKCSCGPKAPFTASKAGDCNDGNPSVFPGAKEVCNAADDNCNGIVDSDSPDAKTYYVDADNDSWGTGGGSKLCSASGGFKVLQAGDCNDNNGAISPVGKEICNGLDDNCSGQIDEGAATSLCPGVGNGAPSCSGGKCGVVCNAKWFDVDGQYGTGCECPADGQYGVAGGSCAGSINLGDLADTGTSVQKIGNIVPGEAGDWYRFKAVDTPDGGGGCDKFKVNAKLAGNADGQFVLDLYRGTCAGANQLCVAQTDSGWTTSFSGQAPYGPQTTPQPQQFGNSACTHHADGSTGTPNANGTSCGALSPSPEKAGECKCTAAPGLPGMNVCSDNTADFFVRVYRLPNAPPICVGYVLEISNGL